MAKTIDLQRVTNMVMGLRADQLVGLQEAVAAKAVELNVRNKARTARSATAPSPNANLRGLVDWVASLTPPVDTCALDKAAAAARGDKYVENADAAARYKLEGERFSAQLKKLQSLNATLTARMPAH